MKNVFALGSLCFLVACGPSKPMATHFTKSGNCKGPSVMTLRFAPEPSAHLLPGEIWLEQCPNGTYYMRKGNLPWVEITKRTADTTANALSGASRRGWRMVD